MILRRQLGGGLAATALLAVGLVGAGAALDAALEKKIRDTIRRGCTPRHVPAKILQVADIPRTRSGKIAELAVRELIHGRPVKNTEALANPEALELYRGLGELEG